MIPKASTKQIQTTELELEANSFPSWIWNSSPIQFRASFSNIQTQCYCRCTTRRFDKIDPGAEHCSRPSSPLHLLCRVDSGPPRRAPHIYSAVLTPSVASSPSATPDTTSGQRHLILHRVSSTRYSGATLYRAYNCIVSAAPDTTSGQWHLILGGYVAPDTTSP